MAIDGKGRPTKQQADEKKRLNGYLQTINAYEKEFSTWEGRAEKIIKRYRDDRTASDGKLCRFNILWANVQTLVPATFARLPQPDVSRRFRDNDPVGRVGSMILERALEYEVQHYPDFRATLKQDVQDRFLGGRGTAWARYEPHFKAAEQALPVDGTQISEDVDEPDEQLDYECAPTDYVHWKDYGHSVARTWEEVQKVWRRVYLTRPACIKRFGKDVGSKIPLDTVPDDMKHNQNVQSESADYQRALVYELWDKERLEAVWISKSQGILDTRDDPLGLEGFFPCPRPLYATITNETLIPVPDFALYQDQARELDTLSDRIDGLVKALQVKGVHDAAIPELARLFTEANNTDLIPVKNWAGFSEKNGLKGAIDLVDLAPIAKALSEAYLAMAQIKEQVYEITGISDIIRGSTDPKETLGAQNLKANYSGLRLKSYQEQVAMFATELLKLKGQIICAKFDPNTIMQMAAVEQLSQQDQALVPQAMALLLGERFQNPEAEAQNPLRSFRIDIAADTLVQLDEEAEKASRVEFLTAVGTYMEKAMPIVQVAPEAGSIIIDLLKFGVTGFKVGKQIEGALDEALDKMRASADQPKPPPVDPEMEKVKAESAARQQELQATTQADQQRLQAETQAEQQRMAMEANMERQRMQNEAQMEAMRQHSEQQRAANELQMEAAFERFKALLEAKTKVETAEIAADASVKAAKERPEPQGATE